MSAEVLHFRPMTEMPNRIRELRMARGWSQDQLAARVGCSKPQISDLERGNRGLDLDWMRRLADALGVLPAHLLSDHDNPERLTDEERALIWRYRDMPAGEREMLERVADVRPAYREQPRDKNAA